MKQFLNNLINTLNEEFNVSITENGAIGYKTSGNALLDLNFAVSSLRNMSDEDVISMFAKTYLQNKKLVTKWLFFAGDVRGGMGERRLFRLCLTFLAHYEPNTALKILPLVPEYTRWDNYLVLLDSPLRENVCQILKTQLEKDIADMKESKPISLLAKWMPSINASSSETRQYALTLLKFFGWSAKEYRQTLSSLRAYLKVVEVSMSDKRWSDIDYEAVPSKANLIYRDAFLRNDFERRFRYLQVLGTGKAKINAGVLFPHDIVNRYIVYHFLSYSLRKKDETLEELWKALPDYVKGDESTICVADGSGSMLSEVGRKNFVTCLDVANALAIYFAERCSGAFKNKYITFSAIPRLVDLGEGKSLHDKIKIALSHNELANTNIEAVFDLILLTAVKSGMKQIDLPKNILILSDMEFDSATACKCNEKLFKTISDRYAEYGYKLPRLIFWNICSRTNTIPVRENELGVALVSGFSPVVMSMVLSNKLDPWECLLEAINSPRYQPVEDALNS